MKARNDDASEAREFQPKPNRNNPTFNPEVSIPAKARSKRSRGPPCNWTSRFLVLPPTTSTSDPDIIIPTHSLASTTIPVIGKKQAKAAARKKDRGDNDSGGSKDGCRCLHCATDKTPQWQTGPMGPKTLCNACGVRYKSSRLVPEYRPVASPTFVLTKHSNSHLKVLELRRQKEMLRGQQHQQEHFVQHHHQGMMFDVSNGDNYLIHQYVGPDFMQLIQ